MSQLLNTVQQILHSDGTGAILGIHRHLQWQMRKMFRRFPCELPLGNSRLFVDRPGGVAALVNAMGKYDFNNMSFLAELLSLHGGTFFDVGANIGSYTLIASEVSAARVIGIEPHPATFARLRENVRRNNRENVISLNIALSSAEGEVKFTDFSDSALNRVLASPEEAGDARTVRVPARTLQSVCRDLALVPDFVKIDVEGHERAVLDGFGTFAGASKVIFVENGERSEIRAWMAACGYTGPWFPDFRRRALAPVPQARPEDTVYVQKAFLPELQRLNFNF